MADCNTNLEQKTFCNFVQNKCFILFYKVTRIIRPAQRRPLRHQNGRLQYDYWKKHNLQLFAKKWKFQNSEDSPPNLACPETAPEAPKRQITLRLLIYLFVAKKKQKRAKNQLSLYWPPNRCRPGEVTNQVLRRDLDLFFHFFGAKVPCLGMVTSVA